MRQCFCALLGLVSTAYTFPNPNNVYIPRGDPPSDYRPSSNSTKHEPINWAPCQSVKQIGKLPLTCGKVTVPLDYTDPASKETFEIELVRAASTKKPFKGSILMNFGGPGGKGSEEMANQADEIHGRTGGHHDIIGFDQRGTGNSLLFSCSKTPVEAAKYTSWLQETDPLSDAQRGRTWATSGLFAETCEQNAKDVGSLIGSAFVARDMMEMVDALNEDGKLRFWGLSYGTALGFTVASMFPDRMDKIVLDGVTNPYEWWNYHDVSMFRDTDKTLRGFAAGCVAKPQNCALAKSNSTAASIEQSIYDLLTQLELHPQGHKGQLIDASYFRGWMLAGLYSPSAYSLWAYVADNLIRGNTSVINELPSLDSADTGDRRMGIACSDKKTRGKSDTDSAMAEVLEMSRLGGPTAMPFIYSCANWKMDAKERYKGNFNAQTANPVLVIGNTHDPVTSLDSAKNLTTTLQGSVLLTQDGFGHSSLGQVSNCTINHLQAYLIEGKLPDNGTVCKVDEELFEIPYPVPSDFTSVSARGHEDPLG